jgi:hypothetical protein
MLNGRARWRVPGTRACQPSEVATLEGKRPTLESFHHQVLPSPLDHLCAGGLTLERGTMDEPSPISLGDITWVSMCRTYWRFVALMACRFPRDERDGW